MSPLFKIQNRIPILKCCIILLKIYRNLSNCKQYSWLLITHHIVPLMCRIQQLTKLVSQSPKKERKNYNFKTFSTLNFSRKKFKNFKKRFGKTFFIFFVNKKKWRKNFSNQKIILFYFLGKTIS